MTLTVERLTPNGEIRTADLIASIAKRIRSIAGREYNHLPHCNELRSIELRKYAERLEKLAKAMEVNP